MIHDSIVNALGFQFFPQNHRYSAVCSANAYINTHPGMGETDLLKETTMIKLSN